MGNEYYVNCIKGELDDVVDRITIILRTTTTNPDDIRSKLIFNCGIILSDVSNVMESLKNVQ